MSNRSVLQEFYFQDKRNFMRGPPAGVQYHFDYAVSYPVAMVMLEEDANLKAMRFELVPKQYVSSYSALTE